MFFFEKVSYSYSFICRPRNNIFVISCHCYTTNSGSMSLQIGFLSFSERFHILNDLSKEPEIIYLLLLVTATVLTEPVCPCKTVSCLLTIRFHTLIVVSLEPEIIYLLSPVTTKVFTQLLCHCKTVSCFLCKRFHTLIVLSFEPVIT